MGCGGSKAANAEGGGGGGGGGDGGAEPGELSARILCYPSQFLFDFVP